MKAIRRFAKALPGVQSCYTLARRSLLGGYFDDSKSTRYDKETQRVIERVVHPKTTCIDIGAHRGDVLKWMIKRAPMQRHMAIEALPHLADRLRQLYPGIVVKNVAVSDYSGTAEFLFVENDPAYSGLRRRAYRPDAVVKPISVPVCRIDDIVEPEEMIGFVKIDIEGGEYHALLGAKQLYASQRPITVFECGNAAATNYEYDRQEVFALFACWNMSLSTMRRWLDGQPPLSRDDWLANAEGDYYWIAYPKQQ